MNATRHAQPIANSAHVVPVTLPPLGSMQCFTPTTESPSIAATSTARAPLKSSASPAIACAKPATGADAAAVPYSAGPPAMPGGGRIAGAAIGGGAAGAAIVCAYCGAAGGGGAAGRACGGGGANDGGAAGMPAA